MAEQQPMRDVRGGRSSGDGDGSAGAPGNAPKPSIPEDGAPGNGHGPEETPFRVHLREDHAAIARLADDLLPALIAKLTASGLGEIEVREGGWKARLRKPDGVTASEKGRHAGWSASTTQASGVHAGHAHAAGRGPAEGPRRPCDEEDEAPPPDPKRAMVTSPAVGIYHPRRDLTVGMRVRAGDKIGTVDVLGIREEVASPVDGVVGASLVESGDAVEYGQELVRIELPGRPVSVPEDDAVAVAPGLDAGPEA